MRVELFTITVALLGTLTISVAHSNPSIDKSRSLDFFAKAQQYELKRRPDLALTEINKALELQPKNPNFLYLKSGVLLHLEEDDAALNIINKAIQINPRDSIALTLRATIYRMMKRYDGCRSDLLTAIQIDPKNFRPHCSLAELDIIQRRWEEAKKHLDESLKLYPPNVITLADRVNVCSHLNKWNQVLADATTLVSLSTDNVHYGQWHRWKARAYDHLNKIPEARAEYLQAIKLLNADRSIHQEARAFYAKIGDKKATQVEDRSLGEFDIDIKPWR